MNCRSIHRERRKSARKSSSDRHHWLLYVSLVIAVILEFLPVEADILVAIHSANGNISTWVARIVCVKLVVLASIFAPMAIYLCQNRWSIKHALMSTPGILTILLAVFGVVLTTYAILGVAR